MKKFEEIVKEVSNKFLNEAKQSPQIIADMAKMEYYMAESYSGRLFIELLQNADDARSTRIISFYHNGNLYFGNNGKPFDEDDLIAISRSGASGKQRGKTIGYRGIGFKSASSVSDDITIYSSNTYFTFSKEKCAKLLNMKKDDVPTIRIPIYIDEVEEDIKEDVEFLKSNGYSTIFIFKNANVDMYIEEIKDVDDGYFLFLNNVYECSFDIEEMFNERYQINRFTDNGNQHIEVKNNKDTLEWMIVKNRDVSVAFFIENGIIVPCDSDKAVYHCYLPTIEKSIMFCKINADFSTDPSRKHITLDNKSKQSLDKIAEIFSSIFEMAINEADTGKYKNIFNMYLNKSSFSKINLLLDEKIDSLISERKWIKLNNGNKISPKEYKMMPSSFDLDCPEKIRTIPGYLSKESLSLDVYENIDGVDDFFNQYSEDEFELDDFSEALAERDFVNELNDESHIQLLTNVIRETKIKNSLNSDYVPTLENLLVKNNSNELVSMEDLIDGENELDYDMKEELSDRLGSSEISWLQNTLGTDDFISSSVEEINTIPFIFREEKPETIKPHISKWRDAEQKCLQIEESFGNVAEDVSIKNLGYDIYSVTPTGEKRYIEVKSVKRDFSFSLTNNEYTAAHEYGENYYICLLLEKETELEVRYIKDPLNNAKFEKRIKQWEWICLESTSTSKVFEFE